MVRAGSAPGWSFHGMKAISDWLVQSRRGTGKTQAELATALGVSQAQVSQWERGRQEPTAAQVSALAKALGVKVPTNGAKVAAPEKTTRGTRAKANSLSDSEPPSDPLAGFEKKLWASADKLRGNMDAAEYKHVVLGLIFLKYISDAFDQLHGQLAKDRECDPEDRDEYVAKNVFWVPEDARWAGLQASAKTPVIGKKIDKAMEAIEADNPSLKGVLPKDYSRAALDKRRLGGVVDLLGDVGLVDASHASRDLLGKVYEYFLGQFAAAEGKKGGQFYTPQSIVRTLVECIEPFKGRVYDPCCGSGGMFVQSEKFVEKHGGRIGDIAVYGQESNATTWRLAKMNLAIRSIEADLGKQWADTFHDDQHKGLKADFVLANPPFNDSDWGGNTLRDDARWKYGAPPVGNANYAWLQHIVNHLSSSGVAGVVLANGSMSSQQSGEGEIRRAMLEADLIDCMIALPAQLFANTGIPACLWILARNKADRRFRRRTGELLFIDARKLGTMVDRVHREFSDADIAKIANTYHRWRAEKGLGKYKDAAGFCKRAKTEDVAKNQYVLTPGRYVGSEQKDDHGEPFEERMPRLAARLREHFAAGAGLDRTIQENLAALGYDD